MVIVGVFLALGIAWATDELAEWWNGARLRAGTMTIYTVGNLVGWGLLYFTALK